MLWIQLDEILSSMEERMAILPPDPRRQEPERQRRVEHNRRHFLPW